MSPDPDLQLPALLSLGLGERVSGLADLFHTQHVFLGQRWPGFSHFCPWPDRLWGKGEEGIQGWALACPGSPHLEGLFPGRQKLKFIASEMALLPGASSAFMPSSRSQRCPAGVCGVNE